MTDTAAPTTLTASPIPRHLVCFAHGKESGPWGIKITRLAQTATRRGFDVVSPDYSHTPDPRARLSQLLALRPCAQRALVLVGSSMGGWVSAMACGHLKPNALLLLAPALYFPGYDEPAPTPPQLSCVIHGWDDDIVPVERAIRYAGAHRVPLHVLDSGHGLNDRLAAIEALFDQLLQRAQLDAAYRASHYKIESEIDLILKVDIADAAIDAKLRERGGVRESWALLSACNPASIPLSGEENRQRHAALIAAVNAAGLRHLPTIASDPDREWPDEPGLLLCDPPPGIAEQLGRDFGQNAVLISTLGAAVELRWL